MKKILILMIIALSASAYSFCTKPEETLREKVKEFVIERKQSHINDIAKFRGEREGFLQYLGERCGVSSNFSLSLSNGTSISFSTVTFLDTVEEYLIYLYNKYDAKDDMLTKYALYMLRPPSYIYNEYRDVLTEERLNALYISNNIENNVVEPMDTIMNMLCNNNYSTDKISGHLEPQFQEFLLLILQKNFKRADDVLNMYITDDVNDIIEASCSN